MGVDDTHNLTRECESFIWIALIHSDTHLMVWEVQYSREPVLAVGGKQKKVPSWWNQLYLGALTKVVSYQRMQKPDF